MQCSAFTAACLAEAAPAPIQDDDLQMLENRISAEFREMPGLLLTTQQAARLFNLDTVRCGRVLDTLVARGVLAANGRFFALAGTSTRCA